MATVKLEKIGKKYKGNTKYSVKDFNLDINDGEFVVFVGPSGCGKSTTLRMIAGLESISEGSFYIDGKLMNDAMPKERDIAMVF
ncbi:MAG: ATP-binding cassette domain-containing protein, partial [Bacilli bacterium]